MSYDDNGSLETDSYKNNIISYLIKVSKKNMV